MASFVNLKAMSNPRFSFLIPVISSGYRSKVIAPSKERVLVAVEVKISFVLMSCQVVFLVIPYPRMFPGLFPMLNG